VGADVRWGLALTSVQHEHPQFNPFAETSTTEDSALPGQGTRLSTILGKSDGVKQVDKETARRARGVHTLRPDLTSARCRICATRQRDAYAGAPVRRRWAMDLTRAIAARYGRRSRRRDPSSTTSARRSSSGALKGARHLEWAIRRRAR